MGAGTCSYRITYEPLNRIAGVKAKTVVFETAGKAWIEVYGLMASDEKVTIVGPRGRTIEWQELKELAAKEAH
jgi:hypothetical protein